MDKSGNDLPDTAMANMSVSRARENFPAAVEAAQTEAVIIERYGKPAAVLISPVEYERMRDAREEPDDVAAFDAAMAEEGENIPPRPGES